MMDNEELLREGECPASNCIEELGHAGPHSGDRRTMTIEQQIEAMRDEAREKREARGRGGDWAAYDVWSGQVEMANRVLALLDVLAEVEGWMHEGAFVGLDLDKGTAPEIFTIWQKQRGSRTMPVTVLVLRRESDES